MVGEVCWFYTSYFSLCSHLLGTHREEGLLSQIRSWVPLDPLAGPQLRAPTPILWPPDAKSWLIGKDPDAGKDWGQEEKGTTEDEMVGWHHWLNGLVTIKDWICFYKHPSLLQELNRKPFTFKKVLEYRVLLKVVFLAIFKWLSYIYLNNANLILQWLDS